MKNKRDLIICIMFCLIIVLTGCTKTPAAPNMDATVAVNVAVAQTAAVLQTQAAQTISAFEQMHPTESSTATSTATPEFTSTPEIFTITLSKDTYCRTGTSSKFPSVMYVNAGTSLEVIARNPTNDSYYVKDPNHTNTYCWIWGEYATPSGDQKALRMYTSIPLPTNTPTPTPAPDFSYQYAGMDSCGGGFYLRFLINNTGKWIWQSVQINLTDTVTSESTVHPSSAFIDYAGCSISGSQSDLTPGEEGVVAAYNPGQFSASPSGHSIGVTITVCRDANGGCISKSFTMTP